MEPLRHEIFRILSRTGAEPQATATLPGGLGFAQWHNEHNDTVYDRPGHHALSVYLDGGQRTERLVKGRPVGHGFPGAVCLLPAESVSAWRIRASFHFLHFYFDDSHLTRTIEWTWDTEPGARTLDARYLFESPVLASAARLILADDWAEPASRPGLDHLAQWLLVHIVQHHMRPGGTLPAVPGRLGHRQAARIREFVGAHLDEPLTLDRLAGVLHLSPYHFARLFRATFGEPPYRYLLRRRMERGRVLLTRTDDKIASIALRCGFGDHSQFTRAFRRYYGVTPSAVRGGLAS